MVHTSGNPTWVNETGNPPFSPTPISAPALERVEGTLDTVVSEILALTQQLSSLSATLGVTSSGVSSLNGAISAVQNAVAAEITRAEAAESANAQAIAAETTRAKAAEASLASQISSQQQPTNFIPLSQKGVAGGVAALDANGRLVPTTAPAPSKRFLPLASETTAPAATPLSIDFVDTTNGAYTVPLPPPGNLALYIAKRYRGANTLSIDPGSAQINGASGKYAITSAAPVSFLADGTNWWTV